MQTKFKSRTEHRICQPTRVGARPSEFTRGGESNQLTDGADCKYRTSNNTRQNTDLWVHPQTRRLSCSPNSNRFGCFGERRGMTPVGDVIRRPNTKWRVRCSLRTISCHQPDVLVDCHINATNKPLNWNTRVH